MRHGIYINREDFAEFVGAVRLICDEQQRRENEDFLEAYLSTAAERFTEKFGLPEAEILPALRLK